MPETTQTPGSNSALAFILGGVVVALGLVAWFAFGGGVPTADKPDVRIELPGGKTIEGEVQG